MRGKAVKELQDMLRKLGYSIGGREGFFGANTRDAVMDFQRKNKLRPTGIANPQTIAALKKMITASRTNKRSDDRVARKYSLGNKKKVIGKRLREWRIEKGWKGYLAAKAIGISQCSLSDIENGNSYPGPLKGLRFF